MSEIPPNLGGTLPPFDGTSYRIVPITKPTDASVSAFGADVSAVKMDPYPDLDAGIPSFTGFDLDPDGGVPAGSPGFEGGRSLPDGSIIGADGLAWSNASVDYSSIPAVNAGHQDGDASLNSSPLNDSSSVIPVVFGQTPIPSYNTLVPDDSPVLLTDPPVVQRFNAYPLGKEGMSTPFAHPALSSSSQFVTIDGQTYQKHTVQPGDTLLKIANSAYDGDGRSQIANIRVASIVDDREDRELSTTGFDPALLGRQGDNAWFDRTAPATPDYGQVLHDPDLIRPGQTLLLPVNGAK